jgi:hypothetical protein
MFGREFYSLDGNKEPIALASTESNDGSHNGALFVKCLRFVKVLPPGLVKPPRTGRELVLAPAAIVEPNGVRYRRPICLPSRGGGDVNR